MQLKRRCWEWTFRHVNRDCPFQCKSFCFKISNELGFIFPEISTEYFLLGRMCLVICFYCCWLRNIDESLENIRLKLCVEFYRHFVPMNILFKNQISEVYARGCSGWFLAFIGVKWLISFRYKKKYVSYAIFMEISQHLALLVKVGLIWLIFWHRLYKLLVIKFGKGMEQWKKFK